MKTKATTHQITITDLIKWRNNEAVLYAIASIEKSLSLTLGGKYCFKVGTKIIWEGEDPEEAVRQYNSI